MIRYIFYIIAIINFQLYFSVHVLQAAEIVIVKSSDITPYNQTIAGFIQEIRSETREYNLKGDVKTFPEIIKDINDNPPKLILALGALAAIKAKEYISDIPIIYTVVLAPEDKGLIGKNLTGISIGVSVQKQLEAIKKLIPKAKKVGVLYSHLTKGLITQAEVSCPGLGLELVAVELKQPEEVPDIANNILSEIDVLWLIADRIVVNKDSLRYILLLSMENNIPLMSYNKNFVKFGALLSLTVNYTQIGRQAAKLSRLYLQGKKLPKAILPSEEIEYAINLHTAQFLGIEIPSHVLDLFKYVYK